MADLLQAVADRDDPRLDEHDRMARALVRIQRWRRDPQAFATDLLGEPLLDIQLPIVHELTGATDCQRTVVRSANGCGKTNALAKAALWFTAMRPAFTVTTAPTWPQVRDKLWQEMARLYRRAAERGFPLGGTFLPDSCRWKLGEYWQAVGTASNDASSVQGAHTANILILFDEAQGVHPDVWTGAEGMMVDPGARWIAIGNPLEARGPFYAAFRRPHEWRAVHLDAMEHPNVRERRTIVPGAISHGWVEERRAAWGETDPRFLARVRGEFPVDTGSLLVSPALLEKAAAEQGSDPAAGIHIGVDVARFGDDETIILPCEDNVPQEEIRLAGLDGNQVAGRLIRVAEAYDLTPGDADRIHVDSIGIGASVVDALDATGWKVDAVNFGAGPRGTIDDLAGEIPLKNLRAEAYWTVRELLKRGEAHVPPEFGRLWEDLSEPTYSFDRNGRLVVEDKAQIKARLGRSPDAGDAFALACCRSNRRVPVVGLGY